MKTVTESLHTKQDSFQSKIRNSQITNPKFMKLHKKFPYNK